jgi:hypothetical protein
LTIFFLPTWYCAIQRIPWHGGSSTPPTASNAKAAKITWFSEEDGNFFTVFVSKRKLVQLSSVDGTM